MSSNSKCNNKKGETILYWSFKLETNVTIALDKYDFE